LELGISCDLAGNQGARELKNGFDPGSLKLDLVRWELDQHIRLNPSAPVDRPPCVGTFFFGPLDRFLVASLQIIVVERSVVVLALAEAPARRVEVPSHEPKPRRLR